MAKQPFTIPLMALVIVVCLGKAIPGDEEGWTPLFDGKTLNGWKVNGGIRQASPVPRRLI